MMKKSAVYCLIILLMSAALLTAAQEESALTYSSPVAGTIDDGAFSQSFTLQTASADRIAIEVERTSGNLIPELLLLDANSQQLGNSYGSDETGAAALIANTTLPAAGNYTVVVQRKDGETGVTSGGFSLTVIPLATAADNPNNTLVIGQIEYDQPLEGELSATQWVSLYTLQAQAEDRIAVVARRTSGTLVPEVEVRDINGTVLSRGYTDQAGDFAEISSLDLPGPGQYNVAVTRQRDFAGNTMGGYVLTVNLLGAGTGAPSLAGAAGSVEYDTPISGTLTHARWYEDWQLTAPAADTLTIMVERPESVEDGAVGNLQPEVILLGGSGQELRRGYYEDERSGSVIERYQLDTPGSYSVRVIRRGDQDGVTTGVYRLTVALVGSGTGSPDLAEVSGTVQKGEPVEGEITPARWADSWTYQATEGEDIDIKVTRTSGTLIPQIEIRDINGQSLRTIYPEPSRDMAVVARYRFPSSGEYRIVVTRDRDQNGLTTGTYTLSVNTTEQ